MNKRIHHRWVKIAIPNFFSVRASSIPGSDCLTVKTLVVVNIDILIYLVKVRGEGKKCPGETTTTTTTGNGPESPRHLFCELEELNHDTTTQSCLSNLISPCNSQALLPHFVLDEKTSCKYLRRRVFHF